MQAPATDHWNLYLDIIVKYFPPNIMTTIQEYELHDENNSNLGLQQG